MSPSIRFRFVLTVTLLHTILFRVAPVGAEPFASGFFLLPAPANGGIKTLLVAPLLDGEKILKVADANETDSRRTLSRRLRQVVSLYCNTNPEKQNGVRAAIAEQIDSEFALWQTIQQKYEASFHHLLHSRLERRVLPEQLAGYDSLHRSVLDLQKERQLQIHRFWNETVAALSRKRACRENEQRRIMERMPQEPLYPPYYFALYRFFGSIPNDVRIQLILSMD